MKKRIDVSFISLRNIYSSLSALLKDCGIAVVLVKPQFEVGKGKLGKNGVVRDEKEQKRAVKAVIAEAEKASFVCKKVIESPILGGEGNREYLAYLKKNI